MLCLSALTGSNKHGYPIQYSSIELRLLKLHNRPSPTLDLYVLRIVNNSTFQNTQTQQADADKNTLFYISQVFFNVLSEAEPSAAIFIAHRTHVFFAGDS